MPGVDPVPSSLLVLVDSFVNSYHSFFSDIYFNHRVFSSFLTEYTITLPIPEEYLDQSFSFDWSPTPSSQTCWSVDLRSDQTKEVLKSFLQQVPLSLKVNFLQSLYSIVRDKNNTGHPFCEGSSTRPHPKIPYSFDHKGIFCQVCGSVHKELGIIMEGMHPVTFIFKVATFLRMYSNVSFEIQSDPDNTLTRDDFAFLGLPFISYSPEKHTITYSVSHLTQDFLTFQDIMNRIFGDISTSGISLIVNDENIPLSSKVSLFNDKIRLSSPNLSDLISKWLELSEDNTIDYDTM